jgi:hypothetical protein
MLRRMDLMGGFRTVPERGSAQREDHVVHLQLRRVRATREHKWATISEHADLRGDYWLTELHDKFSFPITGFRTPARATIAGRSAVGS